MKKVLSIIFILTMTLTVAHAQVSKVIIQASGLTCSMCSNAINKSLSTLPFIDNIKSNIKESSFDITIKPSQKVDFSLIKKKVEDAGFFIAGMEAQIDMGNVSINQDSHIEFQGALFHFVNVKPMELKGVAKIRFLDKGYVSAKEYKKNSSMTKLNCFKSGKTAVCCGGKHEKSTNPLYHVTL